MSVWESIARIEIDGDISGTGFLVTKEHVLTALHVVADKTGRAFGRIRLQFGVAEDKRKAEKPFETEAELVQGIFDAGEDFALLKCTKVPKSQPLVLTDRCRPFRECSSPGFAVQDPSGFTAIGKIASAAEGAGGIGIQYEFGTGLRMKGHSGAPVLIDSRVAGILRTSFLDENELTMGGICFAASMEKVVDFCNQRSPGLLRYHAEITWPTADPPQERTLADRKDEFEAVRAMLGGRSRKRVFLLEGPNGLGKTSFVKELVAYAAKQPGVRVAEVDCKGGQSFRDGVESMVLALQDVLSDATLQASGVAQAMRLIEDLASFRSPVLLAFDTWEESTSPMRDWVVNRLLGDLDRAPAALVLIAGKETLRGATVDGVAERRPLGPIMDLGDWSEFFRRRWPKASIEDAHIDAFLVAAKSSGEGVALPGEMVTLLESFASQRMASSASSPAPQRAALAADEPAWKKRVEEALEAAAIAHWFDDRVLAALLGVGETEASSLRQALLETALVESFQARNGWNVRSFARVGMRLQLQRENPERFRALSSRAAACWPGEEVASRIETIYHRLAADPAQAADELRALYRRWDRDGHTEAVQALAVAIEEIAESSLADEALGAALFVVGRVQLDTTKLATTERRARLAAKLLKQTGPKSAWADARTLLGRVLEKKGKREQALREYAAAEKLLSKLAAAEPDASDTALLLATVSDHIGSILNSSGKRDDALARHEQAQQIRLRLAKQDPSDEYVRRELAVSYIHIGSVLQESEEDRPRALKEHLEAQRLLREGVDLERASIDWRSELASAHHHAGSVYLDQKDIVKAREEYRTFLAILEGLVEADPANARWQRRLAVAHSDIGNVYLKEEKLEAALTEYTAYKETLEKLAQRDPENSDVQRELAVAYNYNAYIQRRLESYPQALDAYEASIRLLAALCAQDPRNTDWQRELAASTHGSGRVLRKLGRPKEALAAFRRQQKILAKLLRLDPKNGRWQSDRKIGLESIAAIELEMQASG